MGCGQSKINIYPRKSKGKNSSKKTVAEKPEGAEEEAAENEQDAIQGNDDDNKKKPGRTKPIAHVGGPLLAQAELSSSQQNFFKMLDEKIENGPDYDSSDETEIALERSRLHALLKDWETASASSRSLPSTPRHAASRHHHPQDQRTAHSAPKQYQRIPPNLSYRHAYNPAYQSHQSHSPPHQALPQYLPQQYQEYGYAYGVPRQYSLPNTAPPNTHGAPAHYSNSSPKHRYPSPMYAGSQGQYTSSPGQYTSSPGQYTSSPGSPAHKMYLANQGYTNGELLIQQQLYNQQVAQYQQSREYREYRQSREQLVLQQQQPNYQTTVHVPIVPMLPQSEQPVQRKQRQYSHEIT